MATLRQPPSVDAWGGGVFRVHVREGGKLVANKEVKVAPRPGRQSASDDAIAPIQAQISALTGAVQKLVELQAQPARREDNEDALLDRMIKYKQIFGGGAPTQQSDPFETVTKMLQLASQVNKMTGNAPPEPPDGLSLLASTAKEVLPLFAQAAAQRQHVASMRAPVADRAPPAVAENPLPAPVASAPQPQPQQDEANMLKMYIGILLKDAQQDLDPTGWAHMIVNHVAPHDIEALLRPDTWFDQLSTFEPKVAPFREWFTELREMVFELLSGEGGTGTTGENSSGGTNHASGGGTSSNTEGHS